MDPLSPSSPASPLSPPMASYPRRAAPKKTSAPKSLFNQTQETNGKVQSATADWLSGEESPVKASLKTSWHIDSPCKQASQDDDSEPVLWHAWGDSPVMADTSPVNVVSRSSLMPLDQTVSDVSVSRFALNPSLPPYKRPVTTQTVDSWGLDSPKRNRLTPTKNAPASRFVGSPTSPVSVSSSCCSSSSSSSSSLPFALGLNSSCSSSAVLPSQPVLASPPRQVKRPVAAASAPCKNNVKEQRRQLAEEKRSQAATVQRPGRQPDSAELRALHPGNEGQSATRSYRDFVIPTSGVARKRNIECQNKKLVIEFNEAAEAIIRLNNVEYRVVHLGAGAFHDVYGFVDDQPMTLQTITGPVTFNSTDVVIRTLSSNAAVQKELIDDFTCYHLYVNNGLNVPQVYVWPDCGFPVYPNVERHPASLDPAYAVPSLDCGGVNHPARCTDLYNAEKDRAHARTFVDTANPAKVGGFAIVERVEVGFTAEEIFEAKSIADVSVRDRRTGQLLTFAIGEWTKYVRYMAKYSKPPYTELGYSRFPVEATLFNDFKPDNVGRTKAGMFVHVDQLTPENTEKLPPNDPLVKSLMAFTGANKAVFEEIVDLLLSDRELMALCGGEENGSRFVSGLKALLVEQRQQEYPTFSSPKKGDWRWKLRP